MRANMLLWLSSIGIMAISSTMVTAKDNSIKPADLVQNYTNYLNKSVLVIGEVDHIEKDGMSGAAFLVVLEGDVRSRISKDTLENKMKGGGLTISGGSLGKEVDIYVNMPRDFSMGVTGSRKVKIFERGDKVAIKGVVKKEMKNIILDKATIKDTDSQTLRRILNLDPADMVIEIR